MYSKVALLPGSILSTAIIMICFIQLRESYLDMQFEKDDKLNVAKAKAIGIKNSFGIVTASLFVWFIPDLLTVLS